MPDREKVIKGLECCEKANNCGNCPYDGECAKRGFALTRDAIVLLREQEPEIVRCKDCKHYDQDTQSCNNGLDGIFLPDWFCADGERR